MPSVVPSADESQRLVTNAQWLVKLRWVAVAGQLLTILAVRVALDVALDLTILLAALGITAISNLAYALWLGRQLSRGAPVAPQAWYAVLGSLMLLDLLVLSVMLGVTGGPTNPFVIFYFVNVALSAVLLPSAWAWTACGVAIAAMGLITFVHRPLSELTDDERLQPLIQLGEWPLAVAGEFIAFVACAGVIVSFLTRLTRELRQSEYHRRRAEELRSRSVRLEALGTLAAGAAHELATPLSTIAVVAGEVAREIESRDGNAELVDDMRLIRGELDRCRAILDRMAIDSGQMIGEAPAEVAAAELAEELLDGLPEALRQRVQLTVAPDCPRVTLPVVAAAQALRGLITNALDADTKGRVALVLARQGLMLRIAVADRGAGMSRETLDRLGEPFFTTKPPGRGMGLGWFLARSVVDRLEGQIEVESIQGKGTTVTVDLPAANDKNR